MDSWADGYQWRRGLEIVSLDFVRPVYGELGIGIRFQETLRGLARDTLQGRYTESDLPLLPPPSSIETTDFYSTHVMPLLNTLERALGQRSRQQLEYWVHYIACSEGQNPWVLYDELMTSWSSAFRRTAKDGIGFSADPAVIAERMRLSRDLAGPRELLFRQRQKFLTDWDFPLFSELGLLEIPKDSEFFPFTDAILLAIGM